MTAVAAFTLTSPATQAPAPFVRAQAFERGDIPAGQYAHLELANFSVVPLCYWNDGSLKHARVMGRAPLTAATALQINVVRRASAPATGTVLTAASITAALSGRTDTYITIGSLGTVALHTLLASPVRTWVSTKEMVECHYAAAIGSSSMWAEFHVQLFATGQVKISEIAGNGHLGGTNAVQTAIPTFVIGGVTVFDNGGAAKTHSVYTRYRRVGWIGGDPQVRARPDTGYLIRTGLVTNQGHVSTTANILFYLAPIKTYTPGNRLGFTQTMGGTGYQDQIGLLPRWDALFLTTQAHPDAYDAVMAHGDAINEYAICFADPATHGPIRLNDFATWSMYGASQGGSDGASAAIGSWEYAHHPSVGYMAYLETGDYYYLQTLQFSAKTVYLCNDINSGNGENRYLRGQNRARAWGTRTVSQAAAIVPDAAIEMLDVRRWFGNMAVQKAAQYVNDSSSPSYFIGYEDLYNSRAYSDDPALNSKAPNGEIVAGTAPWEHHFNTAAWGMALSMEPANSAGMAATAQFASYLFGAPVWIAGSTGADEYNFGYACAYTINFRIDAVAGGTFAPVVHSRWRATNPGQIFQDSYRASSSDTLVNATTNVLLGTSGGAPTGATGYWANWRPAIAYAVEHGKTGAAAAFARYINADNYAATQGVAAYNEIAQWDVVPTSHYQQPLLFTATDSGAAMTTPGPSIAMGTGSVLGAGHIVMSPYRGFGLPLSVIPAGGTDGTTPWYDAIEGTDNPASEMMIIITKQGDHGQWVGDGAGGGYYLSNDGLPDSIAYDLKLDGALFDSGTMSFGAASAVTGVTISPTTANGATTFSATVSGTGSFSSAKTFSKISGGGSIDANTGVFTPPAATGSLQTIVVRATSTQDASRYAEATITIAAAGSTVSGVTVTPSSGAIAAGATRAHSATVSGTFSPSQAVTWTTTLGTINPNTGLVTAPAATSVQQSGTVTATSVQDGTKSGAATFTVAAAAAAAATVTSVTVSPAGGSLAGGATRTYSATVAGINAPGQGVTWGSSAGSFSGSVFTAPAATYVVQTITITATSTVDATKSGTTTVQVAALAGLITVADNNMLRLDANGDVLNTGTDTFVLRGRQYVIDKDPQAIMFYGIDMASYLARAGQGITLVDVSGTAVGIEETVGARVQGNALVFQCAGGVDPLSNLEASNSFTFHFTLSNGDEDDRTLIFNIVDR